MASFISNYVSVFIYLIFSDYIELRFREFSITSTQNYENSSESITSVLSGTRRYRLQFHRRRESEPAFGAPWESVAIKL